MKNSKKSNYYFFQIDSGYSTIAWVTEEPAAQHAKKEKGNKFLLLLHSRLQLGISKAKMIILGLEKMMIECRTH
jgi:hypothetical protein